MYLCKVLCTAPATAGSPYRRLSDAAAEPSLLEHSSSLCHQYPSCHSHVHLARGASDHILCLHCLHCVHSLLQNSRSLITWQYDEGGEH